METTCVHGTRADSHAEHTLFTVHSAELGHGHVQSCLAHCIGCSLMNIGFERHLWVRHPCRYGDYFLRTTLQDQRHKGVEKVDCADGVDAEVINGILFEGLWIAASIGGD